MQLRSRRRPVTVLTEQHQSLSAPHPSAECVFKGKEDGDYHKNMTGPTFMAWLRGRFFPAFRAQYFAPGGARKRAVLFLDNAAYHRVHASSWVDYKKMNRAQLVEYLLDQGEESVSVERQQLVDRKDKKGPTTPTYPDLLIEHGRGGKSAPTVDELRALAAIHADASGSQRLAINDLFKEESQRDGVQHEVVWLPPYACEWNPIEQIWARAKHQVARHFKGRRTMAELREQLIAALYDPSEKTGCTSAFVGRCVGHAVEHINSVYIPASIDFTGSLADLKERFRVLEQKMVIMVEEDEDELLMTSEDGDSGGPAYEVTPAVVDDS